MGVPPVIASKNTTKIVVIFFSLHFLIILYCHNVHFLQINDYLFELDCRFTYHVQPWIANNKQQIEFCHDLNMQFLVQ